MTAPSPAELAKLLQEPWNPARPAMALADLGHQGYFVTPQAYLPLKGEETAFLVAEATRLKALGAEFFWLAFDGALSFQRLQSLAAAFGEAQLDWGLLGGTLKYVPGLLPLAPSLYPSGLRGVLLDYKSKPSAILLSAWNVRCSLWVDHSIDVPERERLLEFGIRCLDLPKEPAMEVVKGAHV